MLRIRYRAIACREVAGERSPRRPLGWCRVVWFLLIAAGVAQPGLAVTPESPEVRELVARGLGFLETNTDDRLGGKCLVALAFLKDGSPTSHPRLTEAIEACNRIKTANGQAESIYDLGLAVIFLAELDAVRHRNLIEYFSGQLAARQKDHGGWGYQAYTTGDTSQTQYAALSIWELVQSGMAPRVESIESCANWLLRTQDPSGAWGYQGVDSKDDGLVVQTRTSLSMLTAGLGSTMILGNVLGVLQPGGQRETFETAANLPPALRRADASNTGAPRQLHSTGVDRQRLLKAVANGQTWFEKNFTAKEIADWSYPCYLLYSIERYKSFEELLTDQYPEEPEWYQVGYEYLAKQQAGDGSWHSQAGKPCATAFSILFLLRSTQKSIKASLGEGTLIGGRGLSANLAKMKLRRGALVVEQQVTGVDKLLEMLESGENTNLDALLESPAALEVGQVGPDEARRLAQIVRSGDPAQRILAVRALARLRDLDYVPTLLYAMTDPDYRVVRAARDGLRLVSRKFGGFGLNDNFTDAERYNVLDQWKNWYRRVRPDAVLEPLQ